MKLSIALATYNEEENIGRCLEAVKDLADEIVIIDGFSTDKIVDIIKNYEEKQLTIDLNEILNIPEPYGNYWSSNEARNLMIILKPEVVRDFCKDFPYQAHYPLENEMNNYCVNILKNFKMELFKKETIS